MECTDLKITANEEIMMAKGISRFTYFILSFILLIGCAPSQNLDESKTLQENSIKPFSENPYYL